MPNHFHYPARSAGPRPPRAFRSSEPPKRPEKRPQTEAGEYLYGLHPVAECLRAGRRAVKGIFLSGRDRLADLEKAAGGRPEAPVQFVPREECQRLCGSGSHQGVVALAGPYPYVGWEALLEPQRGRPPLLLALDGLTDPQNVGAILRTALCAGASGVTLRKHHAALITPAVVKASAGASEHLSVGLVPNQAQFLAAAGEAGFQRVALDMGGDSLWEAPVDWGSGIVLVVGAEGRGVSRLVGEGCDAKVRIPMSGAFDSLNASVAASLALFEAARHRS